MDINTACITVLGHFSSKIRDIRGMPTGSDVWLFKVTAKYVAMKHQQHIIDLIDQNNSKMTRLTFHYTFLFLLCARIERS